MACRAVALTSAKSYFQISLIKQKSNFWVEHLKDHGKAMTESYAAAISVVVDDSLLWILIMSTN